MERLRSLVANYRLEGSWRAVPAEAADEIERLRMRVENARLAGDLRLHDNIRSDALEEAARVAEGWFTRDGALAEADDAKHDIAAHIRARKENK